MKKQMLMRDYVGRKVRVLFPIVTRGIEIPVGKVCTVDGTWRGMFHLKSDPCPHCGVAVYIRKVEKFEVELIEGRLMYDGHEVTVIDRTRDGRRVRIQYPHFFKRTVWVSADEVKQEEP